MKKKGLIISTVVMVVVLIASLTTATYAWFTVSNRTTISGFDVSVVAGNAVNIGVKMNNTHEKNATNDKFASGTLTWTAGQIGALGKHAGSWEGTINGLSATLTHGIKWGQQTQALGAFNGLTNTKSTTASDYGYIGDGSVNGANATGKANHNTTDGDGNTTITFLNAANASATSNRELAEVKEAVANRRGTGENATSGDYAYLFLGAAPATKLKNNQLIIMLDGTNSTGDQVGMLAAVHVAYRLTKAGAEPTKAWTEAEFFGCSYNESLASQATNLSEVEKAAYSAAHDGKTAPLAKAGVVRIGELSHDQGAIDQIEIIIYLAGSDADCNDNAKNASGTIEMFFATVTEEATADPTEIKIDSTGKLNLTGTKDAAVEVKIGDATEFTTVKGKWTESGNKATFISDAALPGVTNGTKVIVKITATGKSSSKEIEVKTNEMTA